MVKGPSFGPLLSIVTILDSSWDVLAQRLRMPVTPVCPIPVLLRDRCLIMGCFVPYGRVFVPVRVICRVQRTHMTVLSPT